MFANDTNLFISNIKVNELFSDINCELKKISFWFKVNKLWLKLTKTKYFLFHPASKKKKKRPLRELLPFFKMNNISIERENVTKFIGVNIDENLSWKQHINDVNTKISISIDVKNLEEQLNNRY